MQNGNRKEGIEKGKRIKREKGNKRDIVYVQN